MSPASALRLAVFGHPVAHSLSPRIHAAFGRQCGIALDYAAIDATPAGFAAAVDAFAMAGGSGANVTLPHKAAAAALCTVLSARARRAGAVNTLVRRDDAWHGDNTDGIGLVRDLVHRHGIDLHGRRALLLGAGGAAAGVAPALLDAGIAELVVANRGFARARALVDALAQGQAGVGPTAPAAAPAPAAPVGASASASASACGSPSVPAEARFRAAACALDALPLQGRFDLLINATSATRGDGLPPLPGTLVDASTVAVDLGYGEAAAGFLGWARACGIAARIDGLGMLVEQAAESFALWTGATPATGPVHAALRADCPVPAA